MIRPEHLAYFKDLLEGRAEISWIAWFRQNERQLSEDLPRMAFLQLKFHKLDEAERLLKGRPKKAFLRKAYGGAAGHFMDGRLDDGRRALHACLNKLKRRPILERAEELNDICYDGERELTLGDPAFGRAILEWVAALPTGNDLLDPAIDRARELLTTSDK